jgi:hypothetical protein
MADDPQINIGQILSNDHKYELSVSNEKPEDGAVRRIIETADAELKRKMTFSLFCFSLLIVGVVFVGCIYLFATGTAEDKKWSAGVISAIVSGLIGFLVGQGKKQ